MNTCKSHQTKFLIHERLTDPRHGITQKWHLQREKRNFNSGNKTKVYYKVFTDSLQHNSSYALQISLLNHCSLNKLHSVIILYRKKIHQGLNQEISEAIRYYYVDLKLFLQKVGYVLYELPIAHGKGPNPGPTTNVEIDFMELILK